MTKAEEQAEQMFPEPQMENYDDILEYRNDRDWTIIARGAFVKGYEQAKEEMMKGAIDAVVVESYGIDKVDGKWENVIHPKIEIESDKLSIGDKVKVIIIKE